MSNDNPFRSKNKQYKTDDEHLDKSIERHKRFIDWKTQQWGKKKFTPKTAPTPVVEPATPWKKFKNEIIEKKKEDDKAQSMNLNSSEAKEVMKNREKNYRKMLIMEKRNEATEWETFDNVQKTTNNSEQSENKKKKVKKGKKLKKGETLFLPQKLLDNFDSKKLTFKQNDVLRRVITKTTNMARGETLGRVVKDLKRQKRLKGISEKEMNKKNKSN